ncbi:thiamine phosphate synthase [Marinobacter daepoensis]|uniref:Thiamine-phosphate synthase n=1 Tax=Marinobacter daepoensis TaxID=262077 RepID=A0ABS3BC66_9GAMM|nr:thiamine phosphate synthase [Marinobacter daepoensis]MBY6079193.1 thiamine phosphate synthase [Marinobacter daepoensis]
MGALRKPLRPGLYAITDNRLTPPETLIPAVEAALRGGARLVQYRDKGSSAAERLSQAQDLSSLCQSFAVPLLINDDPELAIRVGAAGVHLGQNDCALSDARRRLGDEAIIGITCHHSMELARSAAVNGADYLAFGRFYHSDTKPGAPPASPEVLGEARTLGVPVTAIGGITRTNAEPLIRAGADLLAVVGGLFGGQPDDIEARALAFSQLFARHHPLFSLSE